MKIQMINKYNRQTQINKKNFKKKLLIKLLKILKVIKKLIWQMLKPKNSNKKLRNQMKKQKMNK